VLLVAQKDGRETYKVDDFPPWTIGDRRRLDVVALAFSLVSHLTLDSHQLRSQLCKRCTYWVIIRRRLGWEVVLLFNVSQSLLILYLRSEQANHIHNL